MSDNAPGWQPDPTGRFDHRYWDGSQWTDNVANAGVSSTDPYDAGAGAFGADATEADAAAPTDAATGDPTIVGPGTDGPTGWAAPTAAQPATPADQTAAWPASPPPPAFPPPVGGTPAGPPPATPGGGSKRGLLVGGGILAVVAIAVVAFLTLGGDDEDDGTEAIRTEMISGLRDAGLSPGEAECVADGLIDEVDIEDLEGEDFSNRPDAVSQSLLDDTLESCEADPDAMGGGDDDDSPTTTEEDDSDGDDEGTYGSDEELDALYDACEDGDFAACDELYFSSGVGTEYEAFGETCGDRTEPSSGSCEATNGEGGGGSDDFLPDDMDSSDMLTDVYEDMGIPRDKAECLADRIQEAMDSGELAEEDAFSDIFGFFEDCDIDPTEIGTN